MAIVIAPSFTKQITIPAVSSLPYSASKLKGEGVWGSGYIDPRIPDLGTSWR
jgi:hypothetical protein